MHQFTHIYILHHGIILRNWWDLEIEKQDVIISIASASPDDKVLRLWDNSEKRTQSLAWLTFSDINNSHCTDTG